MSALNLILTQAGIARFTAAQLGEPIDLTVAAIGLTAQDFFAAPTLTDLPGEFRRVTAVSGEIVGDNVAHIVMRDDAEVGYVVRGFGLFLEDGTLLAAYGQPGVIVEKSPAVTLHLPLDLAFPTPAIDRLTFGDANMLNPPATTTKQGVAKIATQAAVDAGTDNRLIVTPKTLAARLGKLMPSGTITLFYGAAAPAGWAICDGGRVTLADGSEIDTPDLRGRVAVGVSGNYALGATFGAASHDLITSRVDDHAHQATATIEAAATGATIATTTRNVDAGSSASGVISSVTLNDPTHGHAAGVTVDPAGAHDHTLTVDVMQPSVALHYIMKL